MDTVRGPSVDRSPADITSRGWKEIARGIFHNVADHRLLVLGAGSAFYTILALSPTLAALVSLYGLFADAERVTDFPAALSGLLPPNIIDVLRDQVQTVGHHARGTLGATLGISLALSLWSANRAAKALIDALNIVYGERERRGLVRLNLASLCVAASAVVMAVIALGGTVVLPLVLQSIALASVTETLLRIVRWPFLLAVGTLALALLYYLAPDRERPRWRWVSSGSAAASVLWLICSILFSWYATHVANFGRTYGSLGGIVALMLWLWLSIVVILLGAEIDAEMEEKVGERPSNEPGRAGLPGRDHKM
jgi:membrane protein